MSESLFLNKKRIDLYEGKTITRKIQIGEVSEVVERKSSFSYTIKIPKTSNNIKVLNMLSVNGNTSRKPFEEVVADYVIDNVYLIENGIAIIRSNDDEDFSINLIDGFRGLSNILGEKKINEIDFSDLDHNFNAEVLVDSFSNTEGYIYAFGNFGKEINSSSVQNAEKQAPSIFLHTIVERIFEEAGFDLIGDFFTTNEKYLKEVVTPSNGYEVTPAGTNVIIADILGDIKQVDIIKDLANRHGLLMKPNSDITGFEFKKLQDVLNNRQGANDWTNKLVNIKNETYKSGYAQINTAVFDYGEGSVQNLDGEILIDNFNASLEKEIFKSAFEMPSYNLFGHSAPLPALELFNIPIWGDYVQKETIVENELSGAVLATPSRLKQDGTTEAYTGGRIVRYEDIETYSYREYAVSGAVIGSGYCMVCYYDASDVFISYEIAGSSTLYAQEKVDITVPASTKIIRVAGITANPPKLYIYDTVNYDSAEIASTKPKIMYIEKLASNIDFEYFSSLTVVPIEGQEASSEYVPFLRTKYISLQYSLDNYYKSFKDMLNNFKKVDLIANLSLIDVYNLDFFRLKYLKQTGRFYYINNLTYSKGKVSKCEALELFKFAENYPPEVYDFLRKVNSEDITSLKTIIISQSNFLINSYDKEFDEIETLKIIDGFNSNIKLYQNGNLIDSETEIPFEELNLTATAQILDGSNYIESWNYKLKDKGSGKYSENSASLKINALAGRDFLGAIKPSPSISFKSGQDYNIVLGVEGEKILTGRYSTDPYDFGDDTKYYDFIIISKPTGSTAYIEQNREDYECKIKFTGVSEDLGSYTVRLINTTLNGITEYDDLNFTITEQP